MSIQTPTKDWITGLHYGEMVRPPLVSLVLINWNYAAYVGEAIDSIRSQDYPSLEAIVVDNGSTDASREVIAKHVGNDERFRIIHFEKNLGQLGAFLDLFKLTRGEFVTVVDADDVLFSNFISSHVQVHLALPRSVAFTSSNVVEINAAGRALTGGCGEFTHPRTPITRGLRPADRALKLSTISDADYLQLAKSTSSHRSERGWFWAPGTANMYRRNVLSLIHYSPEERACFRAADYFLNPLCHVLGSSALIDRQLSAYQLHDTNYYSERESISGLRRGRAEATKLLDAHALENMRFLLQRADYFAPILTQGRFWWAVNELASFRDEPRRFLARSDSLQLFVDYYDLLHEVFGEAELLGYLRQHFNSKDLRFVLRRAHGGWIPPRLQLSVLREEAGSLFNGILRKDPAAPVKKRKLTQKKGGSTAEQTPGVGPVAVLSNDPPIFMTGIVFDEVLGIAPAFGRAFGSLSAAFLIYPCSSIEAPDASAKIIEAANAHLKTFPSHQLAFLCNTAAEKEILSRGGLTAHLLNKNFMVADSIFRPLSQEQIQFDAVYYASFVPDCRHDLASKIGRVAYVSCGSTIMQELERKGLERLLPLPTRHALINPIQNGLPIGLPPEGVNAALNRAAVGLCLSKVEGSTAATMEYMLAGLPVVTTPSIGGREIYFDHEYCTICEPNSVAVRDAVVAMKARNIPREYIRARTLSKIDPDRQRFLSLIDDLTEKLGGRRRHENGVWPFTAKNVPVTWKTYAEHLQDFEKVRGSSGDAARAAS